MIFQWTKTIQDLLNKLMKYSAQMTHLPDVYMFHKQLVSELCDTLHNEVFKKGYTAEFSTIKQIFEAAWMIEDVSLYHLGTWCMGNTGVSASITQTTWNRLEQTTGSSKPIAVAKSGTIAHALPSKPYNGYKPDQKPVQMSRSLALPSSQPKQMTCPPDCTRSTILPPHALNVVRQATFMQADHASNITWGAQP